jgi:hypothetical protein
VSAAEADADSVPTNSIVSLRVADPVQSAWKLARPGTETVPTTVMMLAASTVADPEIPSCAPTSAAASGARNTAVVVQLMPSIRPVVIATACVALLVTDIAAD